MPSCSRGFLAILLVVASFFLFDGDSVFASDDFLTNADFEDWDNSGPVGWQKSAGTYFSLEPSSAAGTVKTGSLSALLKLTTSNYRYLYQTASVSGGTAYRFSGSVRPVFGAASVLLRLAWYCQGCTSQISTDDSTFVDKTSPDFSDLSVEVTSPANAAQVKARVVVTPATGSTDNQVLVDNLFFTAMTAPGQTVTAAIASLDWSLGKEYKLGEVFTLDLKLRNFDPNQDYYLKLRAGVKESELNKGQTKNGPAFFSDTESWSRFPQVRTDAAGSWNGSLSGRVDESRAEGQYVLQIRVRKKDSDTFYDSGGRSATFSLPPVVAATAQIASPVAISASTSALSFVLATASAQALGSSSAQPQKGDNPGSVAQKIFLGAGLLSLFGSSGFLIFRKLRSRGI